jgi:hypothetical protein
MQEAFIVLRRAIQDAERRQRQYESEGDKSKHKLSPVRHAIRDLEEAYSWLQWCHGQKLVLIRLWNLVEEGNRNVQIRSSSSGQRRSNRKRQAAAAPALGRDDPACASASVVHLGVN